MIRYEWVIETMDDDDIASVDHADTLAKAVRKADAIRAKGLTVEVGLVRDQINDIDENLEDRQWAYLENGKLPAQFDGGARVPRKYHSGVRY